MGGLRPAWVASQAWMACGQQGETELKIEDLKLKTLDRHYPAAGWVFLLVCGIGASPDDGTERGRGMGGLRPAWMAAPAGRLELKIEDLKLKTLESQHPTIRCALVPPSSGRRGAFGLREAS